MIAIAAGKTYLTAGGYVVEIINDKLHSSERTAPGVTAGANSKTCLEINKDPNYLCKDGWYYEPDGTVGALTEEWTEKLRIVEELPFPIPKLPEGYEWADGYPQFREIKKGECYISNLFHTYPKHYNNKDVDIIEYGHRIPSKTLRFERKRFAVVRATAMPTPEPAKILDPLVEKYGEPEAGWRWLADDEEVEKGDECMDPYDKTFIESGNYISGNQTGSAKPYRRKIEIATTPSKEEVVMEKVSITYPRYYKHRDDGFVDNIKYIERISENNRNNILKSGETVARNYFSWDSNCDDHVKNGVWIEVTSSEVNDFIASIGEAKEGEWVECIDNSGYSNKLIIGRKYKLQKPAYTVDGTRFYQLMNEENTSPFGENWKANRFKKTSPPTPAAPAPTAPVEPEMVILTDPSHVLRSCDYIKRRDIDTGWNKIQLLLGHTIKEYKDHTFACELKDHPDEEIVEITDRFHIGRSCDFIKHRDAGDWNPLVYCVGKSISNEPKYILGCKIKDLPQKKEEVVMNFPRYYNHKKGFTGTTKYVKRINKDQYTCILKDTGKEAENEILSWNKWRIQSVADGTWVEVPEKEVLDFIASVTVTEANPTLVKKEEIEMKKETLVKIATGSARFAGNWGFKAANYFFFETAANIARPILRSARYAVFLGSLSAAVYGYNHPDVVKNAIKSCLPKITIEAPEVLKG